MKISIISPVYNEKENILIFLKRIIPILNDIHLEYEIIFVADPSSDGTETLILDEIPKNKNIKLITMSRRFGQPAAMLAGIKNSNSDYLVLIDADLQDPPELIKEMYEQAKQGYDVVLARRNKKIRENLIRKIVSYIGYFLIWLLSETKIPKNVGEFRLITKRVVDQIKLMEEKDFFLRGIISYIGFKQKIINFDRDERAVGKTKYNKYFGSLKIGLSGIFSFSTKPLHFITLLSSLSFFISTFVFISYMLLTFFGFFVFKYQFFLIVLIFVVSSLIFFSQGIISEYLARLINDIKKRPNYIIDKKYNFDEIKKDNFQ
jgi:glycosyltransferase involved in cell wall biosynthesis